MKQAASRRPRKSWREKLADAKAKPGLPKTFFCEQAKKSFVVPSPAEIEALIKTVKRGKIITIAQMGEHLQAVHKVDLACPMTTGIFTWIIAHAANEAAGEGARRVTPWWRVLKTGGLLNPKFPGGGALQRELLQAEGHAVVSRGKQFMVADYEKSLASLG